MMTSVHALVIRYATPFALHTVVSSAVLAIAIAASYLPRLSARTRFALLTLGMAKFLLPAALFAPFMARSKAVVIPISISRVLPVALPPPTQPSVTWIDWLVLSLGAVCLLLIAGMIASSVRTVDAALRSAEPAAPRDVAALSAARKRIGVPYAIDLVRSPISEAPAVLRVLRPLIVLPADGPDVLQDDELESLLCHECAHVARRDNLLTLFEGMIRSLFWFNPLVWFAHRRLAEEREKACDEIVADRGQGAETYAQALAKVCATILARPAAGVSCMASAHLKQRMEHIMRYSTSRWKSLAHLATTSAAVVFLFAAAAATAAISRNPSSNSDSVPYAITATVGRSGGDLFVVRIIANEKSSGRVAWTSRWLSVKAGESFSARGGSAVGSEPNLDFVAEGRVDEKGQASVQVEVIRGGDLIERVSVAAVPKEQDRYTGEKISLNLKDADIRDVLKTFAKLSGLEITAADDVEGKIDVNLTNIPWDEALDRILKEHGYTWRLEGNRMNVFRQ